MESELYIHWMHNITQQLCICAMCCNLDTSNSLVSSRLTVSDVDSVVSARALKLKLKYRGEWGLESQRLKVTSPYLSSYGAYFKYKTKLTQKVHNNFFIL